MERLTTSAAIMYLSLFQSLAIALAFVHQSHYLQLSLFCLLHQGDGLRIGFSGFSLSEKKQERKKRRKKGGGGGEKRRKKKTKHEKVYPYNTYKVKKLIQSTLKKPNI